jgi:alkylhydroperoxidase family enzyme
VRTDEGGAPTARLPYVDPTTASEEVRETFAQLPITLNVFRMMAHARTNFRPLVRLGTSILGRQQLAAKLRELAILRVARLSPARYEWVQHVPIARAVGASAAQVEALERDDVEADAFDAVERAVLRFTTEVVRDVRASERTFTEIAALLTPQEVVELLLTIGYYMMIARLLETTAVDLDAPAGTTILDAIR